MRSTVFVILSFLIHSLCVAALVLTPMRMAEKSGDEIEVTIGEESVTPGLADAEGQTASEPAKIEEPKTENEQAKEEPKVVIKEVQKVTAKNEPVKKVAAAVPAALPKKKTVSQPASKPVIAETSADELPESLDSQIDDAEVANTETESAVEEKIDFKPVKETPPVGVVAATDEDTVDLETEASSTEAKAQDPAPVAIISKNEESDGEPLGKGGATESGAVTYTDLRQNSGNQPPVYPLEARRNHREGEVELLYQVTSEGRVTNLKVSRSSGHEDLDQAAVKAISKYKFIPGQEGWAKHPVQFSLTGQTATLPSRLRTMGAQSE